MLLVDDNNFFDGLSLLYRIFIRHLCTVKNNLRYCHSWSSTQAVIILFVELNRKEKKEGGF